MRNIGTVTRNMAIDANALIMSIVDKDELAQAELFNTGNIVIVCSPV